MALWYVTSAMFFFTVCVQNLTERHRCLDKLLATIINVHGYDNDDDGNSHCGHTKPKITRDSTNRHTSSTSVLKVKYLQDENYIP
jgi:hypothetical protein